MPSTTLLIQIIVAIGGFSGLASLVQTLLSRQKGQADAHAVEATAAQVVTTTATSLIAPLREQVASLQRQVEDASIRERELRDQMSQRELSLRAQMEQNDRALRREMGLLHEREMVHESILWVHARWDHKVAGVLQERGIIVDAPPPLFPPDQTGGVVRIT